MTYGLNNPTNDLPASNVALLVLTAVNLLPLAGVLLWDWSIFEIVFLYWCENLIVGFTVVLKILFASPDIGQGDVILRTRGGEKVPLPLDKLPKLMSILKIVIVPFFIFHYGMFCMGHGVFIFAIFEEGAFGTAEVIEVTNNLRGPFQWILLALLASHLVSFFLNYLGRGEYRTTNPIELMMSPYKRIVVMHLTIIFGAAATMFLGNPVGLLLLLVALKIALDVRSHLQERRRLSTLNSGARKMLSGISILSKNRLQSRPS
jgi:hypothetical protein